MGILKSDQVLPKFHTKNNHFGKLYFTPVFWLMGQGPSGQSCFTLTGLHILN